MNGGYGIQIELHGLYGCYWVEGKFLNRTIAVSKGMNLQKHIGKILAELQEHDKS